MDRQPRRAITLAGGGPAAALHIGALDFFEKDTNVRFDVWALSCIGAWVGIYYQQSDPGKQADQTREFFREHVFRDDVGYDRFPVCPAFGPDTVGLFRSAIKFLSDPASYRNLVLPDHVLAVVKDSIQLLGDTTRWNQADLSKFLLDYFAAHPASRFLTSFMYLSPLTGLTKTDYPSGHFLNSFNFARLDGPEKPFIFHNAFDLVGQDIKLFANRIISPTYEKMSPHSLCACSALPYIEETVRLGGTRYCEGALVDTVNFKNLLEDAALMLGEDGAKLDEIWVCRLVQKEQIREPRNLCDALANLCMLFAATVGDDDVKLFRYHARLDGEKPWTGRIVELQFGGATNFAWDRTNFDNGYHLGRKAALEAWTKYQRGDFEVDEDLIKAAHKAWARVRAMEEVRRDEIPIEALLEVRSPRRARKLPRKSRRHHVSEVGR